MGTASKRAALANLALNLDFAAHLLYQAARDGEAQPVLAANG
jgi:hypothetical protein